MWDQPGQLAMLDPTDSRETWAVSVTEAGTAGRVARERQEHQALLDEWVPRANKECMGSQEQEDCRETRGEHLQDQLEHQEGTALQDRMVGLDVLDQSVLPAVWDTQDQVVHAETLEATATWATQEPREQLERMDWMANQDWLVFQGSMATPE